MKKLITFLPVLLVLAGLLIYFATKPHAYYGDGIDPPLPVKAFTLTGVKSNVSLETFRGKVVVLYFGYTFCPDVCPLTMSTLAQALKIMGNQAEKVQVIMISVDPKRDTPQHLANYLASFHPSFIGLTGSKQQIDQVTADFGIKYEINPGSSPDTYLVDHTASVQVLNPNLSRALQIPFGNTAEQIADDLLYLLSH